MSASHLTRLAAAQSRNIFRTYKLMCRVPTVSNCSRGHLTAVRHQPQPSSSALLPRSCSLVLRSRPLPVRLSLPLSSTHFRLFTSASPRLSSSATPAATEHAAASSAASKPVSSSTAATSTSTSTSTPTAAEFITDPQAAMAALPAKKRRRLRYLLAFMVVSFSSAFLFNVQSEQQRSWQLGVMKSLPLNALSRIWGWLHRQTLPEWAREPMYRLWTRLFDCQLEEADYVKLSDYRNLSEFFVRTLKPGMRPISAADMVSPVDARVTVIGEVGRDGEVEQIKGMKYSLGEFLGFVPPPLLQPSPPGTDSLHATTLHYIVFYLAPGDYHRIHNPVSSLYHHRRHFTGHLFPVNPNVLLFVPRLFTRNERVVLAGQWREGGERSMQEGERFFSMVMVGAYNVGSVKLSYDEEMITNKPRSWRQRRKEREDRRRWAREEGQGVEKGGMDVRGEPEIGLADVADGGDGYVKVYGKAKIEQGKVKKVGSGQQQQQQQADDDVEAREDANGLRVRKGEEVARFELGSTVVLVFETLKGEKWEWQVKEGDKVKMGQAVGQIYKPGDDKDEKKA